MLSIKTWKSAANAKDYYTEEQHQVEYYVDETEEEALEGMHGKFYGLSELGVFDGAKVEKEAFEYLLLGYSPDGRELFGYKQNGKTPEPKTLDEIKAALKKKEEEHDKNEEEKQRSALKEGKEYKKTPFKSHRPGYDLTFSAPKSVSILWALGDKDIKAKVLAAHDKAIATAMAHLTEYAAKTRRGEGGKYIEKLDSLMFAKFNHATSRANDPNLHGHVMVFNAGLRAVLEERGGKKLDSSKENKYGAIESSYIFSEAMSAGAIYRAELAYELEQNLGCKTEKVGTAFEVSGVPTELIKHFSTRRRKIEEALKEKGYSSAKSAEMAALSTRDRKKKVPFKELVQKWKEEAEGFDVSKTIGHELPSIDEKEKKEQEFMNYDKIFEEIVAHKSTFSDWDLRRIVAQKIQTLTNYAGFKKHLEALESSEKRVLVGKTENHVERYSTKELHELEKKLVDDLTSPEKSFKFKPTSKAIDKAISSWEKRKSEDKGEPITLTSEQKKMVHDLVKDGINTRIVQGISGSGKSFSLEIVKEIYEENGISVIGLAPTGKAALGLEESTGVKSTTIDAFLLRMKGQKSYASHNRNVFVIDESGMVGSKKLAEIVAIGSKMNVRFILTGDTRQLQPVEAGGIQAHLQTLIEPTRLDTVYRQKEDWQKEATKFLADGKGGEALKEYFDKGQVSIFSIPESAHRGLVDDYVSDVKAYPEKSRIVIAETNRQTNLLNEYIRDDLKSAKKLPNGLTVTITNRNGEEEKREFSVGDRVLFTKNHKFVKNGHLGEILEVSKEKGGTHNIHVKLDSGKEIQLDTKDYNHIEHGYAVTIYKSQGDTIDKTFYLMSEKTSKESAYVSLSRQKESVKIYIDRLSFSERIDWDRYDKGVSKSEKMEIISSGVLESVGVQASKSMQKDTSLSYESGKKSEEVNTSSSKKHSAFKANVSEKVREEITKSVQKSSKNAPSMPQVPDYLNAPPPQFAPIPEQKSAPKNQEIGAGLEA